MKRNGKIRTRLKRLLTTVIRNKLLRQYKEAGNGRHDNLSETDENETKTEH